MLKVMIVDDEMLAVDYMKHLLPWEKYGFQVVCTAYNGRQALKQFMKHSPDVVITDISMPLMSGIELIKEIKAQKAEVRCILLTAYGEFEYARAAMLHGVDSYIMKDEADAGLMLQKLLDIRKSIEKNQHISNILLQKAMVDFQHYGREYVEQHYAEGGIRKFLQRPCCFILLQVMNPWEKEKGRLSMEKVAGTLSRHSLELVIQQAMLAADSYLLFVDAMERKTDYTRFQEVESLCRQIRSELNKEGNVGYLCLYSSRPFSFFQLCTEFPWKDRIREFGFCKGNERSYDFQEVRDYPHSRETSLKEKDVLNCLLEHDFEALEDSVNKIAESEGEVYGGLQVVWEATKSYMQKFEKLKEEFFPERAIFTMKEWKKWYLDGAKQMMLSSKGDIFQRNRPEVQQAYVYIKQNYRDKELKIAQIAEAIGISNSRLSVIFKEDTGMTVNQYITKIRIKKAKELLTKNNYKLYEVAELVGYGNSQYLSQVFYKETGQFPMEYKRQVLE